jgi:hypothetical protein
MDFDLQLFCLIPVYFFVINLSYYTHKLERSSSGKISNVQLINTLYQTISNHEPSLNACLSTYHPSRSFDILSFRSVKRAQTARRSRGACQNCQPNLLKVYYSAGT